MLPALGAMLPVAECTVLGKMVFPVAGMDGSKGNIADNCGITPITMPLRSESPLPVRTQICTCTERQHINFLLPFMLLAIHSL